MKSKSVQGTPVEWSVNTASLLKEALENGGPSVGIMKIPFNIFKEILVEVGLRASQLNDPVLNVLMCRLAIYGEADQYSPDYNPKIVDRVKKHPDYAKWKKEIKTLK